MGTYDPWVAVRCIRKKKEGYTKVHPTSAKMDPASDLSALRPDASDVFSASPASCAS